eukprot:TRINITY_DN8305_c0_g1_i1.p1 TRINITY_DN8305_c0_g1~~TRINITY_DN8305_c0_g1_i1.p1  ORF type:complete len:738 (+),score=228.02 TRINITY_DN8305_c0_g1_i1:35-2248(+)
MTMKFVALLALFVACCCAAAHVVVRSPETPGAPLVFVPESHVGLAGHTRIENLDRFLLLSHAGSGIAARDLAQVRSYPTLDGEGEVVVLEQRHRGVRVIGAEAKFVFDQQNRVVQYSGKLVPHLAGFNLVPLVQRSAAASLVLFHLGLMASPERQHPFPSDMQVDGEPALSIYRTGMSAGFAGVNLLVWDVHVSSPSNPLAKYSFLIDAKNSEVVTFIQRVPSGVNRELREYPSTTPFWVEGDSWPTDVDDKSFLTAAGKYYDTLYAMFNWKSYNNKDSKLIGNMRMNTSICPNAYWDPDVEMMFFCPDLSRYDVATHELGHALTSNLDNGIYEYMSGALQEAFSDTIAETFSQFWNASGYYAPRDLSRKCVTGDDSKLWIIGDDTDVFDDGIRDMYNPGCYEQPSKISEMTCYPFDEDGVHSNCGPPSVLYAVLADGGDFYGKTFTGIGLLKTWHIFFQAKYFYQTSTESFADYAAHLQLGCTDLVSMRGNLNDQWGNVTSLHVVQSDCDVLASLLDAVGMTEAPCAKYTFWGAYPSYVPTTGTNIPVYTAGCATSKEYMSVGKSKLAAEVAFWNPYGSATGWNQKTEFKVPAYSTLGLSSKVNVPFTLASDSSMTDEPAMDEDYSLPMTLTFFDPAEITSISPVSGPSEGGFNVTVTGKNFQFFQGPCGILTDFAYDCLACFWVQNNMQNVAGTLAQFIDEKTVVCPAPGGEGKWKLSVTLNQHDFSNFATFTYV